MARVATNKVSSLVGKLETEVQIKASAGDFYNVFAGSPYLASNASPDIIQGVDLIDGEWGTVDSVVFWNYVQDGKAKVVKEITEAVDPDKNMLRLRVLEGDLMEEFKNFAVTLQVTPKRKGLGSIVHWKLEYEKISEEITHPESIMQLAIAISKQIDKHLSSQP